MNNLSASSTPSSRFLLLAVVVLVQLLAPHSALAQQSAPSWADFQNLIYTENPAGLRKQAKSVTIYSGSAGAAGDEFTPSSSGNYLVRSVIGAPIEGRSFFDLKVGEIITPELAGADYSLAPIISSPRRAFHVPDYTWTESLPGGGTADRTGAVFATSPGYVEGCLRF